jgi:hypothetical protein
VSSPQERSCHGVQTRFGQPTTGTFQCLARKEKELNLTEEIRSGLAIRLYYRILTFRGGQAPSTYDKSRREELDNRRVVMVKRLPACRLAHKR